jgi:succinate dehydrogenase / fumarate reductase, membrane anchor subunit
MAVHHTTRSGAAGRSRAFQWFAHRITGTFLVFLLITHFWVQHYDRVTASVTHSVITADEAERGVLPAYSEEAAAAVEAARARDAREAAPRQGDGIVPAQDAPGPTHPPGETRAVTPYDVLMLRLADPVYAVLWKGFNLLFLLFALHHGFYGLNNVLTDYIRNDLLRVTATSLSWTVALVLFVVGAYSVIVAGLNV